MMKLPRRKFLHFAAGVAALPFISRLAPAQSYPSRPVRLIVGAVPGSAPDVIARLMAQWLSERLGQAFVVENRTGASGNLAAEAVVRAKPDAKPAILAAQAGELRNQGLLPESTPARGWYWYRKPPRTNGAHE